MRGVRRPVSGPTRRSTKGNWTDAEDETLRRAVHEYKGKHWKKVGALPLDDTHVPSSKILGFRECGIAWLRLRASL